MADRAKEIVSKLTLEEKAALCMGKDFWHLVSVERLGLGDIMVADGPHGLRKEQVESEKAGLNDSVPSTCFPTACTTASSWDIDLLEKMGEAIAEECLQEKVSVVLGPGANIKRSPLCGRNFEYFSEDPFQTGEMAAAFVKGVQSKNIGTSLKHYVMNNQEKLRMTIDAVVDERAQREIYLAGFEKCVKQANPWTLMCSYNKVDGEYLSENKRLLTDVLRGEWGYDGLVMTDWGAVNNRAEGIKSGLDLEMPASGPKNTRAIIKAVNDGELKIEDLDKAVENVVTLILKSQESINDGYKYDAEAHHQLAKEIVEQSAVLLKNDNTLPLQKNSDIALIGEFAKVPRYQGAGSSLINPSKMDNAFDVMKERGYFFEYAKGYSIKTDEIEEDLIQEAVNIAKEHEFVLLYAGLTAAYESEGFDRNTLDIPANQIALIEAVSKVNNKIIVVLANGAPVAMPWIESTVAVLEGYLHGQAGAGAIIDILFGDVCPSGKLAETFPIKLEDNSSYNYFPGYQTSVEYRESIYVGYRYYDTAKKDVLFPFGFGLSYTKFKYTNLRIKKKADFDYIVSFDIENIGEYDGAEIAQLYIKNNESVIFKAEKELKGFTKVFLKKGEKKSVEISLNKRSFAYYNINIKDWHAESGTYGVLIGSSSRDIRLDGEIKIDAKDDIETPDYRKELECYYNLKNETLEIDECDFEKLLRRKLPPRKRDKKAPYDANSTLTDIQKTLAGKVLNKVVSSQLKKMLTSETGDRDYTTYVMMVNIAKEMPLKSFGMMTGSGTPPYITEAIAALANRRLFRGISLLLKK
ncbi:MAG: glycoside hydrolase family 3 C-terminal domain-containing protein [Clostridia bacterium]|nr:glycoside hydrolase family 3 C-terminal domain-containing protein [Clostridia bacterium]